MGLYDNGYGNNNRYDLGELLNQLIYSQQNYQPGFADVMGGAMDQIGSIMQQNAANQRFGDTLQTRMYEADAPGKWQNKTQLELAPWHHSDVVAANVLGPVQTEQTRQSGKNSRMNALMPLLQSQFGSGGVRGFNSNIGQSVRW